VIVWMGERLGGKCIHEYVWQSVKIKTTA